MPVLAFDCSAAHCAAALLLDGRVTARAEPMTRGQAERLVPLIEEMLGQAGLDFGDLDRIGVGVGPGNFTGIRIAVATARGLALGLKIPAIGVNSFDAIALEHGEKAVAVTAPRDQVYLRRPGRDPVLVPMREAAGAAFLPEDPRDLAAAIACIAARAQTPAPRPAPLYIRPADAAPASDPPPRILDDA
jgi:tRNA A37 threonylcarbamoyladenosine modification protein TsaB